QVDQTVGTLPHVAHFLPQFGKHQLAFVLSAAREPHALNHVTAHAADEQLPFPGGEAIAGIEKDVGDSDRGHPEKARRLHALSIRRLADDLAAVLAAVTDNGPAIVGAALDDVDLVAAHWAVLAG